MMKHEMEKQIERLFIAFHKKYDENWANLVFEKAKYWKVGRLSQTIDKIIETADKFPPIADIWQISWSFAKEEGKKPNREECKHCDGQGGFSARNEVHSAFFRCHSCSNWKSKYAETIPQWNETFGLAGYKPQFINHYPSSTEHNSQLAKDSIKFIDTIMNWIGPKKEKFQYELAWCEEMIVKYPNLAPEYELHKNEVKTKLLEFVSAPTIDFNSQDAETGRILEDI